MAKQRKTREQKIATSQKREQNQFVYSFTELSKTSDHKIHAAHHQPAISTYAYVYQDVKKTLIVSSAIVAIQILLFLILQHRIFMIPGVSY